MSRPYKVYLAGPISGCNDDQRRHWRAEVHEKAKHFDIIDPTANLDLEASTYEVIERDLESIEEADGLLVCMWKESIGTAVGMVHARAKGKVVVVVDPNRLNNRMLEFYADAVVRTVGEAVKVLERLLRAERAVIVLRKDGSERPFDRGVLVESLREVCRRAGRHDIIVPQLVLVRALAELDGRIGRSGQHRVTTTDIERSVASALAALEASEEHREAVGGVAEAWKARAGGTGAVEPSSRAAADARPPVLAVSVASDKSHATIWGKAVKALRGIPSAAARGIFEEIMRVEGVRDIRLTKMASASASRGPAAQVMTSKTPGVIEGKLFDRGVKGNVQCFQVRVHDERRKDEVRRGIEERLSGKGWLVE